MLYLEKEDLLIDLFQSLDLDSNINNLDDLFSLTISQDKLKDKELINKLYEKIDDLKIFYNSNMLTCLHKNSLYKQKFPALNMLRQICKCNGLKVYPFVISRGYDKVSGRKIIDRYYKITPIEIYSSE
jgi:hypothetical protein